MLRRLTCTLAATLGVFIMASCASKEPEVSLMARQSTTGWLPVDANERIEAGALEQTSDGTWETSRVEAPFPYDELIYGWEIDMPERQGMQLHLKAIFPDGTESPWLYAGQWGETPLEEGRSTPKFDRGRLAIDQLLLDERATHYQFRITSAGPEALTVLPELHVETTDNHPSAELARQWGSTPMTSDHPYGTGAGETALILDAPLRLQATESGEKLPGRCQSAAMATALDYFGKYVPTEDISNMCWDYEYDYPGVWPRTLAVAGEHGYDIRMDRFRSWEKVREALENNEMILASMKMDKNDTFIDPPYASMGGHIVIVNGITADGDIVVVTDSALGESGEGYMCQWLRDDFEKTWMKAKGGVAMVVEAPAGADLRTVAELPPFPENRVEKKRAEEEAKERAGG